MPRHKKNRGPRSEVNAEPKSEGRPTRFPVALGLILLATLIVYLPALNGGVLWDDDAHLTKPQLQSNGGLYRIWFEPGATQQYYPLLHSAFWLEHTLWGDSVRGYHIVNLLWHLIAASLVYFILVRLKIPGALLAAAIFALHPVMVESVAWITEQKNTLSAVFYLSALLVYLGFDESRGRSCYFTALGLFVLGLLTKTVTATLPAALLVIFWWQRGKLSWKTDAWPLIPFFAIGAIGGFVTAWVERTLIGAQGAAFELSFLQRGLLAGRVVWFYLGKLLWPVNLTFIYPRWNIDPTQWWQWLFPIAALAVLVGLWSLRRKSRGPLAGWLFFCGTLTPVLGFLNVYPFIYSYVADHFQYLASLGIIVFVAWAATRYVPRSVQIAALVVLAILSFRQSRIYVDNTTLYEVTLARNPECWLCELNLGTILSNNGDTPGAMKRFHRALELKPDYSGIHSNLGILLCQSGQMNEGLKHLRQAVELLPQSATAHIDYGNAAAMVDDYDTALKETAEAVRLGPNLAFARYSLAAALFHQHQYEKAIEQCEIALQLQPDHQEALKLLAESRKRLQQKGG